MLYLLTVSLIVCLSLAMLVVAVRVYKVAREASFRRYIERLEMAQEEADYAYCLHHTGFPPEDRDPQPHTERLTELLAAGREHAVSTTVSEEDQEEARMEAMYDAHIAAMEAEHEREQRIEAAERKFQQYLYAGPDDFDYSLVDANADEKGYS